MFLYDELEDKSKCYIIKSQEKLQKTVCSFGQIKKNRDS